MAEPNEEQISSIFSLLTFGFVDSVVHAAARTQHLTLDALPVLSDRDQMNNIMRRNSKVRLLNLHGSIVNLLSVYRPAQVKIATSCLLEVAPYDWYVTRVTP